MVITFPDGSVNVPLQGGNNTITIVTTAEDGVTKREYTIKVYKPYVSVTSIERTSAAFTNSATVTYTIKFNGEINSLNAENLSLSATGTLSGHSIQSVTQTAPGTYNVTVNTGSGDGSLNLNIANGSGLSAPISEIAILRFRWLYY